MVAHTADGFGLEFTSRRSWKARRYQAGRLIDIVPVTWTKGFHPAKGSKKALLEVWYQDVAEMAVQQAARTPFVVALAKAKDYSEFPHRFDKFVGVFQVKATGNSITNNSIETEVLGRLRGG